MWEVWTQNTAAEHKNQTNRGIQWYFCHVCFQTAMQDVGFQSDSNEWEGRGFECIINTTLSKETFPTKPEFPVFKCAFTLLYLMWTFTYKLLMSKISNREGYV